jgi:hypothetical protein
LCLGNPQATKLNGGFVITKFQQACCSWRGKDATAPRSKEAIQKAVSAMAGVDSGSIRFSALPPAASFAWDPKRQGSGEILRAVNAKLARDDLTLVALRVIIPNRRSRRAAPCDISSQGATILLTGQNAPIGA